MEQWCKGTKSGNSLNRVYAVCEAHLWPLEIVHGDCKYARNYLKVKFADEKRCSQSELLSQVGSSKLMSSTSESLILPSTNTNCWRRKSLRATAPSGDWASETNSWVTPSEIYNVHFECFVEQSSIELHWSYFLVEIFQFWRNRLTS